MAGNARMSDRANALSGDRAGAAATSLLRRASIAGAFATLLLAGCASERVVLLPSPDGHASRLQVLHGESQQERTELKVPYEAVEVSSGGARVRAMDEAEVRRNYGPVLDAMPAAAASYVVYFETGSIDGIDPESQRELDRALKDVSTRVQPEVTVIGHTDRVGDAEYNDRLSRDRAAVVAAQFRTRMKSLGLDDSNVDVAGRGEREPRPGAETADEVASAKNRRVEISVR